MPLHATRSLAVSLAAGILLQTSLSLTDARAPESRYQEQARRIARRVFEAWPVAWRLENEDKWDFPPKPPWMRWKNYRRLDQRYEAYEEASAGNWVDRVARILARC